MKLTAEVSNENGETLPGSVLLRGPSVAMMVFFLLSFLFCACKVCATIDGAFLLGFRKTGVDND